MLTGKDVDTVPRQEWSSSGDSNLGTPQRSLSNLSPIQNSNLALAKAQRDLEITRHLHPDFAPTSINTQLAAQAGMPYAASTGGLIAHSGNVMANAGLSNANTEQVLAQNRFSNVSRLAQLDTTTLANQIKAGTLTGIELDDAIKLHPDLAIIAQNKAIYDKATTGAQVNPNNLNKIVGTIGLQTDTANQLAGGENKAAPFEAYQRFNNAVTAANASKYAPPLPAIGLPVNPNGTVGSLMRVPGGMTPQMAQYAAMSGMFGSGGMTNPLGAGTTAPVATTSAGKFTTSVPSNPTPTSVLPTGGYGSDVTNPVNKSPDFFSHAQEYERSTSHPNLLINPNTNRVVDKESGQDVTEQIRTDPNLRKLAIELGQEFKQLNESKNNAAFDPHIAKRKAEIARLKAEMSELETHKVNTGLVGAYNTLGAPDSYYKNPLYGFPIAAGQAEAALESAHLPQHLMNGLHYLVGLGDEGYDALFGQ